MSCENLPPATMRRIMKELKQMSTEPSEGIKLLAGEDDITEIVAVITGPQDTPYEGGEFRVRLKLGADFPQAPPKAYFLTTIFHPNVSKTGDICVNTLKKDWKETHGLQHILLTIKCLLIVPNPESALNEEAGRLLLEDYEEYCSHAKMITGIHATPKKSESGSTVKTVKKKKNKVATGAGAAKGAAKKAPQRKKCALKRL
eukprot:CAMPEP_0174241590 /NCGR_PEP_ID=MMETSP0417-20130205/23897_1 /TAXON_ID=242541 /ORGANISM="Mayorella sp, Strain BSH-02190019" /LENGTH=200 /DNA_ID=CAMNT_0015320847 /DNA_START=31 /DNA_END=633 /DNA_ORIENTATION=-